MCPTLAPVDDVRPRDLRDRHVTGAFKDVLQNVGALLLCRLGQPRPSRTPLVAGDKPCERAILTLRTGKDDLAANGGLKLGPTVGRGYGRSRPLSDTDNPTHSPVARDFT